MHTYRAKGIRGGRTIKKLVRAHDDAGARESANAVATESGFELKKLFRLGQMNRPEEIALA